MDWISRKAELVKFFNAHCCCGYRWCDVNGGDVTISCDCGDCITRSFDVAESPVWLLKTMAIMPNGAEPQPSGIVIIGPRTEREAWARARAVDTAYPWFPMPAAQ